MKKHKHQAKKPTKNLSPIIKTVFIIIAISTLAWGFWQAIAVQQNSAREARIREIFASLTLSDYKQIQEDIFGEKRLYDWDDDRSYSSSQTFVHDLPVDKAFEAIDAKIRSVGFSSVGDVYPGSVIRQHHYKNATGEYVRVSVSSKPRDDAFRTSVGSAAPNKVYSLDPNAGPSHVLIKVNLDDNNE